MSLSAGSTLVSSSYVYVIEHSNKSSHKILRGHCDDGTSLLSVSDHNTPSVTNMSLAKLTSLSTQTLSSLLERQRLPNPPPSSTQAILRNLSQLRTGILALEAKLDLDLGSYGSDMGASKTRKSEREAVGLLRNQFGRMRNMLGEAAEGVEAYVSSFFCASIGLNISVYIQRAV